MCRHRLSSDWVADDLFLPLIALIYHVVEAKCKFVFIKVFWKLIRTIKRNAKVKQNLIGKGKQLLLTFLLSHVTVLLPSLPELFSSTLLHVTWSDKSKNWFELRTIERLCDTVVYRFESVIVRVLSPWSKHIYGWYEMLQVMRISLCAHKCGLPSIKFRFRKTAPLVDNTVTYL